jgi:hypothetical protein
VLKRIEKTLRNQGSDAFLADDIKQAARERIFGFELMSAPFVVAHWQIGNYLTQLGAPLDSEQGERAGIYWRDCKKAQCRRARRCLFPQPCYSDRKRAMPPAEWAKAEAACRPLRALLSLGSLKGSEGLWLF